MLCTGCRAVRYCGHDHQTQNWPKHKLNCINFKRMRKNVAKEEQYLLNGREGFMTPDNAFESHVGQFWSVMATRDYVRALFTLGTNLRTMNTPDSVREGLDHMLELLRLDRRDGMGQRDFAPAMMLRLDKDQECYDFLKWWAINDPDASGDWGDMSLPYLDLHGADVMEDPEFLMRDSNFSLDHLTMFLLLKLKLLVDVRNLQVLRKIYKARKMPTELLLMVEPMAVRSPISASRFVGLSDNALNALEKKLTRQAYDIGIKTRARNHCFIPVLFEPESSLCADLVKYERESWEEADLAIQSSYAAYWETSGVLDLLADARLCGARDAAWEIAGILKHDNADHKKDRTSPEERVCDVSIVRIWTHLEDAVENSRFLGPYSERPSEQKRKQSRGAKVAAKRKGKKNDSSDYDPKVEARVLRTFVDKRVWDADFCVGRTHF
ncbi:hypothetical protein SBRCBS47491_006256 [Sporothrix bragantina]|uniref:MYND-type domain-containing protein n=1 Tax=Sporothrix bragantina TaxID=671064 RepID=A0ABP0C3D0_9PEZI